jgi:hypothetical protein
MQNEEETSRRWPFVVGLVVGIGLILAPLSFQMFSRAPQGGKMITAFKPYMTEATISGFQADMATMGRAVAEARTTFGPPTASTPAAYGALLDGWDGINADMSSMLTTMHGDIGDYQAVAALPPFPLFPWFFVAPGVLLVGFSTWALLRRRAHRSSTAPLVVLVVLGVGIIAAPAIFQMWDRAPKGGHMINDFAPLMTPAKVTKVQGYFLVLADGEATLRNEMVPAFVASTGSGNEATALPAISAFSQRWPSISSTMAPMIGAMSDNLGNYAAVKAMPPFPLFPWFIAIPGLILTLAAGGGLLLDRRDERRAATDEP